MGKARFVSGKVYAVGMTAMDESILISASVLGSPEPQFFHYLSNELDQALSDFMELRNRKIETYKEVMKGIIHDPNPGF